MAANKDKRKSKWWKNGGAWIRLSILFLTYVVLFLIGKYSPTFDPNPKIEGRLLSEWTGDLESKGFEDSKHEKAVNVLMANRYAVVPVMIIWLREKDTFPQSVYYFSMGVYEGKRSFLDYRGSYYNQLHAARALKYLGDSSPEVIDALEHVIAQYGVGGHYASELASDALKELKRTNKP